MQHLHDDNHLDNLSRDAAENFQPDHQLHSWDKLHPHVESALPQEKERKRRFIIIFFLFLLIGGGITFSAIWNKGNEAGKPSLTNTTNTVDAKKNSPTNKDNGTSGTAGNPDKGTDAGHSATVTPPVQKSPGTDKREQSTATASNTTKNTQLPVARSKNVPGNSKSNVIPVQTDRNKIEDKSRGIVPDKNVSTQPQANKSATDKPQVVNPDSDKPQIITPPAPNTQPETQNNKPAAINTDPKNTDTSTEKASDLPTAKSNPPKKKQTPELKNRWEFGLVYAPDVSTVKFTHTQKPGSNLGLTIGYNISKRFTVQTGLLYTFKNYKSRGKDYHPPKDYWTSYYKIETVTARCNMWDIPLNLRYNLAPRKNSNLFVSTGLSSYLMRKEDYDFFYYYNGTPTSRYRSMDTDAKDWFSVLDLSVGYERQISRNFSLQAEPFFKQPLTGVGFGKVKLNTTGIFLSVKYKPVKK